ncbi:probable lysophospholipase BODYGUARD 4 isoform X2 [Diospyros lotus]|uniref:probable lysophospholipase BODYGUARD 4 isoform X2 n=1 Tax=Diospyros lotus TaxID=55363 RepID=UPI00225746A8|nr:probable lysophospholipase BODYGUARD 4 isoform X2 [Diospyros lotus]
MVGPIFLGKWLRKTAQVLVSGISRFVFMFLDFLDAVLCVFYRFVDEFLEGNATPCYCHHGEEKGVAAFGRENEVSETLYGRKNVFREMGFFGFLRKLDVMKRSGGGIIRNRWSDCSCESCLSWMSNGDQRLHVVVREPSTAIHEDNGHDCRGKPVENVLFIHGFLSSSLFWTEMVFPNLSEPAKRRYRLFAVDLLGFGRSPKPRACLYTLREHLEMIEKSVLYQFQLDSFHLVAHSMGCVIALALAAKYAKSVKSITLVAPPYFPSSANGASLTTFRRLADKKIWPPLSFGTAVMSWYEHLGRCVCFLFCRNHQAWEWILKLLSRRRHTHHSAWHTMHNVICGGAKLMDKFLEALEDCRADVHVIQGSKDNVVPSECSLNIQRKVPSAEVRIIPNADHSTVILHREKDFTRDLELILASAADGRRGYS